MPDADSIKDDEVILRHIPGDNDHLAEGPRATSANFELRSDEVGISVARQAITSPTKLLARLGNTITGSRIASAVVGELRALGLEVVSRPIAEDAGHAEIVPGVANLESRSLRRKLAKLFKIIDHES